MPAQAITTARAVQRPPRQPGRPPATWAFVGATPGEGGALVARRPPAPTCAIASTPSTTAFIKYSQAVFDEPNNAGVSDAEVAEVGVVAFTGCRKEVEHVPCRLVVRRVKRIQPLASDGSASNKS